MNKLKELRKESKLKQKDVAEYLNMSQNGYSQYETDISNIPIIKLKKLAIFFNVSIDYILNLTNIKTPYNPSHIIKTSYNMNRLKDVREDRDLFQIDIAKILNMSQNGYSQYETSYCDIPVKKLIILAIFYNVPIDYLLYLTDERTPYERKNNTY